MAYQQQQIALFEDLLKDRRLTGSAREQIRIFIDLLRGDSEIGFDTTSALFYGFLNNPDFTNPADCPLSQKSVKAATSHFRHQARIGRAKETGLLTKVARLPLADHFGSKIDLKDLAVAMLTYASEIQHFTFNPELVEPYYRYLEIPRDLYLNVFDLHHDLDHLGIDLHDLIISYSRLRVELVPPTVSTISIAYQSLYDQVLKGLPDSLVGLDGADLENLVMELYDREGFKVVRVGRNTNTPDGGVDIIAYADVHPLVGNLNLAIQCKATDNNVDAGVIRSFNGVLSDFHATKGVFISKAGFTDAAASQTDQLRYPIELMDYAKLSNSLRRLTVKT